jgi:hypothetical protein
MCFQQSHLLHYLGDARFLQWRTIRQWLHSKERQRSPAERDRSAGESFRQKCFHIGSLL